MRGDPEQSVDAQPHPVVVLVGLKVDIRRALADGAEQDAIHEAHHRRFFHRSHDGRVFLLRRFRLKLDGGQSLRRQAARAGSRLRGAQMRRQFAVLDDYGRWNKAHALAHFVQRGDLRRISQRQNHPALAGGENGQPVLGQELAIDGGFKRRRIRQPVQVQQGQSELARQRSGQPRCVHLLAFRQPGDQARA